MGGHSKYTIVYGTNVALGLSGFGYIEPKKVGEKIYCFIAKGENIGDRNVNLAFMTKYYGDAGNIGYIDINAHNISGGWRGATAIDGKYGKITRIDIMTWFNGSSGRFGDNWNLLPPDYYVLNNEVTNDDLSNLVYNDIEPPCEHIKTFSTNWKLYIDGTKLPNYKLLWDNDRASDNAVVHILGIKNSLLDSTKPSDKEDGEILYSLHDECKLSYKEFNDLCGHLPYDEGIGAILPKSVGWLGMYIEDGDKKSSPMVVKLLPKESVLIDDFQTDGKPHLYTTPMFWGDATNDGSTLTVIENGKTHGGEDAPDPDKDDEYENNKDEEEENLPDTANNSIGVLTSTYKMSRDRLSQLGSFLWSGNIFDSFSLVNSNPIENIISCKDIPFSIGGGVDKVIKLGNVDTGVNGEKVDTNFQEFTIGSITIPKKYNNFLDLAPYTKVTIYLPYIGFKELDVTQIMGKSITVKYAVDIITGGCVAEIFCGSTRLYEFNGQIGIDIPITASNRAQVEAGYISGAISDGASLAVGDVGGVAKSIISSAMSKYHYSSTSSPNPSCVASLNRTCYIVIDRPTYDNLKVFNHTRGRMCNLSKKIGNLNGFTICDSHVDLSGIVATDAEKDEIIKILSSGFFA